VRIARSRPLRTASPLRRSARGLSIIELLIALTISATLMSATLAALDTMFKGYKQTTESASTHVISRIVMSRLLGMIRTGTGFAPSPANVLDSDINPLAADYFEFANVVDADGAPLEITRVEYRLPGQEAQLRSWGVAGGPPEPEEAEEEEAEEGEEVEATSSGAGELWYVRLDATTSPATVVEQRPLLSGVRSAVFTLEYDVGPRLIRATIDITVEPNDSQDLTIGVESKAQTFRLVASAFPRMSAQ